ncbi:MAG: hypothetical protein PHX18_07105 [Candidatus Gastranaerophilales bacterium]|nr:hypothetical protein [Candidatus Gastranaerophilales bacterium]
MIFVIDIIAIILLVHLVLAFFYFSYIIYCASKTRLVDIESRIAQTDYTHSFNVVVYANNSEYTIASLINALKSQEYNKEKYVINVILDNCVDETAKVLEVLGGCRLWRLNSENGEKLGKGEAIRWFFDRIFINDTSDAFVFINADSTVRPDFLGRVNAKIGQTHVVSGITLNKNFFTTLIGTVIGYRKIFLNTIIFTGRNIAGLANYLNEDVFAIKKDVLLEHRNHFSSSEDFQFEIPLLLMKKNIKMLHSSDIRVFKQFYESTDNVLDFFNKINVSKFILLKKYWRDLFSPNCNLKSKEFLLSVLYPGEFYIIAACLFIMNFAAVNGYVLGFDIPYFLTIAYALLFIYLMRVANFNLRKFILWGAWVIFSPIALFANYSINYYARINAQKQPDEKEEEENSQFIPVTLTDGEMELSVEIQIINEDALYRVVFWYEKNYMSSKKYLRVSEALKEITDILMEKGFALKICQNCGYFEFANKGRADFDRGNCYLNMIKRETKNPCITPVWDSCENIIPQHAKEFVKKELEHIKEDNT